MQRPMDAGLTPGAENLDVAYQQLVSDIMSMPEFAAPGLTLEPGNESVPEVVAPAELPPPARAESALEIERWPAAECPVHLEPLEPPPLAREFVAGPICEQSEVENLVTIEESPQEEAALKRVLIVDDNADYRDALRLLLLNMGYEVFTGEDGVHGMELARETQPHLVITDFNMPRMNGYELVVALRANPESASIPIVVFTGAANQRQLAGIDLGACRFLEKPFANELLLKAVADFIGPGNPATAAESRRQEPPPAPRPPRPAKRSLGEALRVSAQIKLDEGAKEEQEEALDADDESDSSLIAQINRIMIGAVEQGASDIHFEPQPQELSVRFRVDGSLQVVGSLPINLKNRLATRIKIMAKLVITERRRPQDGQIRAQVNGRKIEFRVSTVPGQHGEGIVLRILGAVGLKPNLAAIGLGSRDLECLERAARSPHGLILVTGPTGSGKSTTLYTLINTVNTPDVKIVTVEDPVEYELKGITQVAARPSIGLTFESLLRAFLRHDPDIIMIGEIRDLETAEIAIKASITGHLVLSTLHTNSAPATITRLTQMGVPPYLVSASVRLVVAQRLIRTLCSKCKAPAGLSDSDRKLLTDAESGKLGQVFIGAGCDACQGLGYRGRMPIFEVMPIQSSRMRQSIQNAEKADAIGAIGMLEGMKTLREAALAAVASGETSFAEAATFIVGD